MPISIYEGPPGGGKSYHAIFDVKKSVDSGVPVYTNIEGLKVEKFSDPSLINMMDAEQVQRPWKHLPKNCLCIIDEALMPFPDDFGKNGDTDQADVKALKKWATQHRHDGQNIILVVQNAWLLARVLRAVADCRVNYFNQGHLGYKKRCRVKFFSPVTERVPYKIEHTKYDVEIFDLYASTKPDSILAGKDGKNIFLTPWVWVPFIGVALGGIGMYNMITRGAAPMEVQERSKKMLASRPALVPVAVPASIVGSKPLSVSNEFTGLVTRWINHELILSVFVDSVLYHIRFMREGTLFSFNGKQLLYKGIELEFGKSFTGVMISDLEKQQLND